MAALLWILLLLLVFVAALAISKKLRKNAFIWFSYVTITGWYYFRVLHKKYSSESTKDVAVSTRSNISRSSSSSTIRVKKTVEGMNGQERIDMDPFNVVEQRQTEQLECSNSCHLSDSASSGSFDGTASTSSTHKRRGIFRIRRKAANQETVRRVSDASSVDLLSNSGTSESNASVSNSATRRTYTGRKKPVSWTD